MENKNITTRLSFLKKFLSGEANFGFWDSISTGIGLINTFFIISALTVYQYGVFQLVLSVYAIFNNFLALGGSVVGNDILRFIGEGKEREAKRLFLEYNGLRLVTGVLMAGFILFGSDLLTRWYAVDALRYLHPLALLLVLEIIFSACKALLTYRLHFKLTASRASLYKIAQLGLLIFFFVRNTLGVREVIFSMIFGSIISTVVLIRPALRTYKIWDAVPRAPYFVLGWVFKNHGKWDIFQQFTSKLTSNLQPWIIKTFISTEAVAIYSIAQTIVAAFIGFFPVKTLNTLIPLQADDEKRLQKIFQFASKYLFCFAIGLGIIAALITPPIIYLLFPKYIPSLPYFFVLLFWMPISALSSVASLFLVVLRKQKYLFYQKVLKGITVLPMLLLVSFIGLWGLVAYQIVFSFLLFYSVYAFLRSVPPGFYLPWRNFFRFDAEDKEFFKTLWQQGRSAIKKKFSFLPI